MKKIVTLFFILLTAQFLKAQEGGKIVKTIKGKVVNESTNEPVSYTNIGLEGTYYGTASNAEGNFELKIPEEMVSKNIYFSAVGFKNEKFPVTDLFDKEFNVVKLQSQTYDIDDIDVAAQSKVLVRILRMASENIHYNYIAGPFNLFCTYSEIKVVNDSIQTEKNAAVTLYDETGYSSPSKLNAFRNQKYEVKKDKFSVEDDRFLTGTTNIDELLELDWARNASSLLNPSILNDFSLKLDSEDQTNWIISFNQKKPTFAASGDFYATTFSGKITVSKDDYSVQKIEGTIGSKKNSSYGKSLAVGKSQNIKTGVTNNFTIVYKSLKPELFSINKTYFVNKKKITEKSELKVNRVQTTNLVKINSRDYYTGR